MSSADWMQWANEWFSDFQASYTSQSIIYVWPGRGSVAIENATIHRPSSAIEDTLGIGITSENPTWIITLADLVLNDEIVMPQQGDQIAWTVNGTVVEFNVMSPTQGTPCWEWFDTYRSKLMVHCKSQKLPENVS